MTNKSVMTFISVNKISVCLSVCLSVTVPPKPSDHHKRLRFMLRFTSPILEGNCVPQINLSMSNFKGNIWWRFIWTAKGLPLSGNLTWRLAKYPLGTRRRCDVESTSMALIQRRNNVARPVGNSQVLRYFRADSTDVDTTFAELSVKYRLLCFPHRSKCTLKCGEVRYMVD